MQQKICHFHISHVISILSIPFPCQDKQHNENQDANNEGNHNTYQHWFFVCFVCDGCRFPCDFRRGHRLNCRLSPEAFPAVIHVAWKNKKGVTVQSRCTSLHDEYGQNAGRSVSGYRNVCRLRSSSSSALGPDCFSMTLFLIPCSKKQPGPATECSHSDGTTQQQHVIGLTCQSPV